MKKLNFFILRIISFYCLTAQAQETLLPSHWANSHIDYLKVRGYLPELWVIERPYTRQQIAEQLLQVEWDQLKEQKRDKGIVKLLYREFTPEMRLLGNSKDSKWQSLIKKAIDYLQIRFFPETVDPRLKLGAYGEINYLNSNKADNEVGFFANTQAGLFWKDFLTLYNSVKIFDDRPPNYIGKEFRGLHAFVEQGYIAVNLDWLDVKFGRDFKQLGPGRSSQLLISDNSRTFDMYQVRLGKKFLQFSFWGMFLDRTRNSQSGTAANRYLNGHRIGLNIKNKLFFGFSEVALYGGPGRVWELGFMNPLGVYYAHNVNHEGGVPDANLLYNLDWDLYLFPNWEIYGEFLIDDFQVDNEEPRDLEPNELGLIAGANWSNPVGLKGGLFNFEYVQVRNRTYNIAENEWNKYLHRNRVIGHALGNNFWGFSSALSYWFKPELNVKLFGNLTRQGEGSVQGEFNEDFLNFTVEEGYSEPFPFGIVERRWQYGLSAFYKPHDAGHISIDLTFNDFNNFQHISGNTFSEFTFRIALWLQWSNLWAFNK